MAVSDFVRDPDTEKRRITVLNRTEPRPVYVTGTRSIDEVDTPAVIARLDDTDLSVHAYGVPDWDPPAEMGLETHGHAVPDLRDSWFVVFDPPRDRSQAVALVAVKPDPEGSRQEAFWTRAPDRVAMVRDYVVDTYG